MPRAGRPFLAPLLALLASAALAQGPAAQWRTLTTEHFRVHFPAASEAWARHAAARMESIRQRVSEEVGYAPPEVVDVVVMDPVARANGMALPILGAPRLVLWTSPPGPSSVIGHFRDWGELLFVHEEAHLVHLLRPSRNPLQRLLSRVVPLGPVARRSPRWVTEGYATVVEGRLTGSGRPYGDLRAAILRRRAQAGKLPSYGRLAADEESWLGMSMAYLAGSAYLEWLEERAGAGSLAKLWARMTARADRGFGEAFRGVFGDEPQDLYDRFSAELTYRALKLEKELAPRVREGEVWQDLAWSTGAPQISGDGQRLAIVLTHRRRPARLVVWSTAPDTEGERRRRERRRRLLARDPDDVPAVAAAPPPREPLYELPTRHGAAPTTPRWLPGGESLLFVRFEADGEGFLHPDLFRWTPAQGTVERLTRGADLRHPDPGPDGSWAVAVRNRHGLSQLVRVELAGGAVEAMTSPRVEVSWAHPRVAPDGRRVAVARHRGAWELVVLDLATGAEEVMPAPAGSLIAYPAWSGDGRTLYATVGSGGSIDVWAFTAGTGGAGVTARRVTRTLGAALAPAPTPGGDALFFLALEADGLDLRRLALDPPEVEGQTPLAEGEGTDPAPGATTTEAAVDPSLAPAVPPSPPRPEPFVLRPPAPSRPYGLGRLELLPLVGFERSAAAHRVEVGVRAGDLLGRLDALALAAAGEGGQGDGAVVAATWRGAPVSVSLHLFELQERPSRQPRTAPALGAVLDVDRSGAELALSWRHRGPSWRLRLGAAALAGRLEPVDGGALERRIGAAEIAWQGRFARGRGSLSAAVEAGWATGRTGGDSWHRGGGRLALEAGHGPRHLRLELSRRRVEGARHPFDLLQLGGLTGSLLPTTEMGSRIPSPALPAGSLLGEDYEGQRLEVAPGAPWPILFVQRHRLAPAGGAAGEWLALAGGEWTLEGGPWPLLRLPAWRLLLGAARLLDEPFRDENRWWAALSWQP